MDQQLTTQDELKASLSEAGIFTLDDFVEAAARLELFKSDVPPVLVAGEGSQSVADLTRSVTYPIPRVPMLLDGVVVQDPARMGIEGGMPLFYGQQRSTRNRPLTSEDGPYLHVRPGTAPDRDSDF